MPVLSHVTTGHGTSLMDALKTLRTLANPRLYLVHQNQAQRLRVHVVDDAGAIAVESADDGQAISATFLDEMIAVDRTTHIQTNDAQMANYLVDAWGNREGQLPCRLVHIDTELPVLEEW